MERTAQKCLAVVRIRGVSDIHKEIKATMNMLHLQKNCHATLLDNRPANLGMLQKAQHYITWGEVEPIMVGRLLKTRGRQVWDKPIDNAFVKANTPFATIGALAGAGLALFIHVTLERRKTSRPAPAGN